MNLHHPLSVEAILKIQNQSTWALRVPLAQLARSSRSRSVHAAASLTREFIELWNASSKWPNNWVGVPERRGAADRDDIDAERALVHAQTSFTDTIRIKF